MHILTIISLIFSQLHYCMQYHRLRLCTTQRFMPSGLYGLKAVP